MTPCREFTDGQVERDAGHNGIVRWRGQGTLHDLDISNMMWCEKLSVRRCVTVIKFLSLWVFDGMSHFNLWLTSFQTCKFSGWSQDFSESATEEARPCELAVDAHSVLNLPAMRRETLPWYRLHFGQLLKSPQVSSVVDSTSEVFVVYLSHPSTAWIL